MFSFRRARLWWVMYDSPKQLACHSAEPHLDLFNKSHIKCCSLFRKFREIIFEHQFSLAPFTIPGAPDGLACACSPNDAVAVVFADANYWHRHQVARITRIMRLSSELKLSITFAQPRAHPPHLYGSEMIDRWGEESQSSSFNLRTHIFLRFSNEQSEMARLGRGKKNKNPFNIFSRLFEK